jgi:hypothetical protein
VSVSKTTIQERIVGGCVCMRVIIPGFSFYVKTAGSPESPA